MSIRFLVFILVLGIAAPSPAASNGKIALINGTLINPGEPKIVPDAVVVIEGDHISTVGDKTETAEVPAKETQVIDCKGKFVLPGYIDTHVHFFQSGDIYTRPDAVDLTGV